MYTEHGNNLSHRIQSQRGGKWDCSTIKIKIICSVLKIFIPIQSSPQHHYHPHPLPPPLEARSARHWPENVISVISNQRNHRCNQHCLKEIIIETMTSYTLTLKEKKAIGKEKKRGKQENDKTKENRNILLFAGKYKQSVEYVSLSMPAFTI